MVNPGPVAQVGLVTVNPRRWKLFLVCRTSSVSQGRTTCSPSIHAIVAGQGGAMRQEEGFALEAGREQVSGSFPGQGRSGDGQAAAFV